MMHTMNRTARAFGPSLDTPSPPGRLAAKLLAVVMWPVVMLPTVMLPIVMLAIVMLAAAPSAAGSLAAAPSAAAPSAAGSSDAAPSAAGASAGTERANAADTGSHVTRRHFANPAEAAFSHYSMDVALDPAGARLEVTGTITLAHAKDVPADRKVSFLLHKDLTITSISPLETLAQADRQAADSGQPAPSTAAERPAASGPGGILGACPLQWRISDAWEPADFWIYPEYPQLGWLDHARQVDLWMDPAAGIDNWPERATFQIAYEGAVYDSLRPPRENYQRGFETTKGLIDPRGAFLSGGSLWYPHRFDEPFTFDLTVTCPPDWVAVSQGKLGPGPAEAEDGSPRPRISQWTCPQPMDEIYLIAGPYVLTQEDHDGIMIQTFTYGNDDAELCQQYIRATRNYLDLYSERIGDYAFDKFALVENFWQTGYGMPSFTLLGDRVIRLPFIIHTSYGHEILHNWWGNGVFVDYEKGNWCEGLTVYGADYLYKEQDSEQAARDYRRNQLQEYINYVRDGRDFPLTAFRSRHDASSAAVGYGKSMMLYHMLRRSMGDDAFWRSLGEFYDRFLFKRASWDDLLSVFARNGALGMEQQDFYDQWIASPGAPNLTLTGADLTRRTDGGVDLTYQIDQTMPHYKLTVPIRATYAAREPQTWFLDIEGARIQDARRLPETPLTLEVDPDFDIFRRLHRAEVPSSLGQIFGADTMTVILGSSAAGGLALDPAGEQATAYRDLAQKARAAGPATVAMDQELVLADLTDGAVWVFAQPVWISRLADQFPSMLTLRDTHITLAGETFDLGTHTLVCSFPHPHARDEAIGWMIGGDGTEFAAVWRKLPHYGKYSYLVFDGSQNVAKGSWTVEHSPLRVVWAREE